MEITAGLVFKIASSLALLMSILLVILKLSSVIDIELSLLVVFFFGSIALLFMAFTLSSR